MKTIKLIEGQFTPKESKELLLKIISSKINFYKLKNLSFQVSFNQPDKESQLKIKELNEAQEHLLAMIEKAMNNDQKLNLKLILNIGHSEVLITD